MHLRTCFNKCKSLMSQAVKWTTSTGRNHSYNALEDEMYEEFSSSEYKNYALIYVYLEWKPYYEECSWMTRSAVSNTSSSSTSQSGPKISTPLKKKNEFSVIANAIEKLASPSQLELKQSKLEDEIHTLDALSKRQDILRKSVETFESFSRSESLSEEQRQNYRKRSIAAMEEYAKVSDEFSSKQSRT